MNDFSIEVISEKYLDDIEEIEVLSYGAHHWSRDSFESEIINPASHYVVAIKDNKCVGYMGVWKIVDEAHITTLAVHPECRGQHIAQALMIAQIEECADCQIKYLTLEVRPSNTPAIKLYEKFGFNSLGVRKKYYQDNGEDAIIMWTTNILKNDYKKLYKNIKDEIFSK